MEDVFILPQTLSSPSGENSFCDEVADTTGEKLVEEDPSAAVPLPESTVACAGGSYSLQNNCSSTDVSEMPISTNGIHTLPAAALELCTAPSEPSDGPSKSKGRMSGVQKKSRVHDPLLNGNALVNDRTFERKKLPPRSRRGMRLEAIVQNITPSRFKVTSNTHSTKKHYAPKTQTNETHPASLDHSMLHSGDNQGIQREAVSEKEPTFKAVCLQEDADDIHKDHHTSKSTSDSEHTIISKSQHCSTSPKPSGSPDAYVKETGKGQSFSSPTKCSLRQEKLRTPPMPKACNKSPAKHLRASPGSKTTPPAKKAHTPKRKRKKRKSGQSCMFSPKEPEIKLKYVNYKEEKRDIKADTFSPFIRLEVNEYSTCTVINYPEEENARLKKGQQQVCPGFISGAVPTTSCVQLGRLSSESKRQSSLVCCVCGRSANALDLGDLHGPYYPEGFKPALKPHSNLQGLKGEDDSDSDSSYSEQGRKRTRAAGSWPQRPCHRVKREAVLGPCHRWASDSDSSQSHLAKKPRADFVADDWYSPPVVPLDTSEYWVHEDCCIWSAGVFLVKGKLYGLEEAVRQAKETSCSTCQRVGATLGCFFKGCPNKYHYTCAKQSDCVLNEDNFSMKCTKHKNKSFRGSSVNRQDDR
ncbi:transcription factor 20-like [Megalops cyprinoides]|uniref:transcription factor 20-like n=1 Tax=Megalops cyprinoides TaxID=118141 RepID=UPI001863DFE7|nr:transcription factor 20-like [Megalops cyprinoides]